MTHVLILGGGFGGLAAAHELRTADPDLDITLVARDDRFFMGFAKLWDLGGIRPLADGTRTLDALARRRIRFVQADVTALDPAERTVDTTTGPLRADGIVVALGDVPSPAHLALLQDDHAHNLYDARALEAIRADLAAIDSGRVLISILGGPFKCPPAPFEAALLVDEVLRGRGVRDAVEVAISTFAPMTLPVAGPDASRYVASHLGAHDVELLAPKKVTTVEAGVVGFDDGSTSRCDILLGVPASTPPSIVAESGLAGPSGFIEPDRHTLRTSFEGVYAVGDCTHIPTATGALPKAGVFAAAEGQVAARNLVADLVGGEAATFDGHGYCFLELPGRRVAFVEGNFYAEPAPDVHLTEADEAQFAAKQRFERERLEAWLA